MSTIIAARGEQRRVLARRTRFAIRPVDYRQDIASQFPSENGDLELGGNTDMSMQSSRPSADTQSMMIFEANKKSTGLTYVLWFFLGSFGAHRFYLGRIGSAVAMLALLFIGVVLAFVAVGFVLLGVLAIWLIVDLFLIPGMVSQFNNNLVAKLTGGQTA